MTLVLTDVRAFLEDDSKWCYECMLCGVQSYVLEAMTAHITERHRLSTQLDTFYLKFDRNLSPHNYNCFLCSASFAMYSSRKMHLRSHSDVTVCPICKHDFLTNGRLLKHIEDWHSLPVDPDDLTKHRN
ncbi:unnamed protein product [Bemisia tabaci]|uniref:C2H2-type domain-containing protein n=1 Tax=Bemisia tabaci TaxID=7038 RepID=A0A9P0ADY7_BEMTA|nr:unnamed protein product [Bemisia tabaci]